MQIKTGIDICSITRMAESVKLSSFTAGVFTDAENSYCLSRPHPAQSYAGLYAAKEAFFKAAGTGIQKSLLKNVEVLHTQTGKPYYNLTGGAAALCGHLKDLSISHDGDTATAVCVFIEGDNPQYIQKQSTGLCKSILNERGMSGPGDGVLTKNAVFCPEGGKSLPFAVCMNSVPMTGPVGQTVLSSSDVSPLPPAALPLPAGARALTPADYTLPPRPRNTHKGSYGKAVILGGSDSFPGSVLLSAAGAEAALRGGAGLCALAVPGCLKAAYQARVLESTLHFLPSENGALKYSGSAIDDLLTGVSAVAIGMGAGSSHAETYKILCRAMEKDLTLIIDADGINALAAHAGYKEQLKAARAKIILTPHYGEFARLTGLSIQEISASPAAAARDFAAATNTILVLKSAITIITNGSDTAANLSGTPAQAKGGSGDVLAGLITGIAAQNRLPLFSAACAACHHLGKAAELAALIHGENSLLASDVVRFIKL